MELGRLDLRNPVARQHPLNCGRVGWWLTLPNLSGGRQWLDVIGLNSGTLTNMTTTASGWRGSTRPGGWGHLLLDGTDDYVVAPAASPLNLTGPFTLAAWYFATGNQRDYAPFISHESGPGTSSGYYLGQNTSKIYFGIKGGANEITFTRPAAGTWHRIIGVFSGTGLIIYSDGKQAATGGNSTASPSLNIATNFGFYIAGNANQYFVGSLDDLSIWNRALSASEVFADYDLSRRGYPGVLNRTPLVLSGGSSPRVPYWHLLRRAA